MQDTNKSEPATKGDLIAGLTELKTELNQKIDSVKTELKTDIGKVWMEVGAMRIKMDGMEEKMSTKDDISRVMNHIDKFAAEALSYRNHDTLRGRAIMDHDGKLENHETRITLLETGK